jgi:acetyltransferase-like isoleucine patch superfamily enzyme
MLNKLLYYLFRFPFFKLQLGSIGIGSKLIQPILSGASRIYIGKNVFIRKHTWLAAMPIRKGERCELRIDDNVYIGNFCHIYATSKIQIGKKVLMADRVYLSDNVHSYQDISLPVMDQPVKQLAPVILKEGCWLGENACVIGATIGKNSVIGANAVVLNDIPDYCVAVGSPAKVIKRYDLTQGIWKKTNENGEFI